MLTAMLMSVVHEEVHQRACQKQEIGQHAEDMTPMLSAKIEQGGGGNRHTQHEQEVTRLHRPDPSILIQRVDTVPVDQLPC